MSARDSTTRRFAFTVTRSEPTLSMTSPAISYAARRDRHRTMGESTTVTTSRETAAMPIEHRIEGAGGVMLGLLDYGDPGSAPPLFLLHGIRDLAWSMDPVARALRDRYRVLSLDLRGHGASDHPGGYTFPHYAADLHCVLDRLDIERVALIGPMTGGQNVWSYAGLFPERRR